MPMRSATLRLLEAIRILGMAERVRYYQASTSELYGKVQEVPQRETIAAAFRRQHGADFVSVMPTNLYGPGDNYHPENPMCRRRSFAAFTRQSSGRRRRPRSGEPGSRGANFWRSGRCLRVRRFSRMSPMKKKQTHVNCTKFARSYRALTSAGCEVLSAWSDGSAKH